MLEFAKVLTWVQSLPEDYTVPSPTTPSCAASQPRKRKLAPDHQQHLASPPASLLDMDLTPTRKRQKQNHVPPSLEDMNVTPRPHTGISRSIASVSTSSSARNSNASSGRSRSASPKKQMMGLRLDDQGLDFRQLTIDTAPDAAADLLNTLEEISRGHDILPHEWRDVILQGDVPDRLPGRIPSYDELELVGEMAKECLNFGHEEAGWNGEVHHQILKAVFREPGHQKGGLFNFAICNTARPHHKYLPRLTPAKMVDLCVYADLNDDENWREGLQTLSRKTPTLSVNHTDFTPLQLRPIMLSIETKKPGAELDKAQLQMGVWHAAQWSFLRLAVSVALSPTASKPNLSSSDQVEHETQVDTALSHLGFIPGIIVQGHKWLFVFSTREHRKTILWTERQFGSTQSILEIYQIVAGLRELAAWARDVYLPWFQEHVLAR